MIRYYFIKSSIIIFFFQAEDDIRYGHVTGVQTCALPIYHCTMVELRGFEPARHVLARTTPAIHFNTSNLSKSTRFCKTTVLWWSYGDSNPGPSHCQRDALAN